MLVRKLPLIIGTVGATILIMIYGFNPISWFGIGLFVFVAVVNLIEVIKT